MNRILPSRDRFTAKAKTTGAALKVLLISTYDLGRQPFGLASPAAWLRAAGADVTAIDLARDDLDEAAARSADLIAIHLPMHTATRLATALVPRLQALNDRAHLCFYGLYAPLNADYLRGLGADSVLGGEFEAGLAALCRDLRAGGAAPFGSSISTARQEFLVPDRTGLPALDGYARVLMADGAERPAGYTEATRGCKHLCRHCPVVPVYQGRFRAIGRAVVLADIAAQVGQGARHISFGDPDFFNGPGHAMRIVEELHATFPALTYDVTIKIEHLLGHARHLERLRATGCLFITTAAESVDDDVLLRLAKGHTSADFARAVALLEDAGLVLSPTFIPFTPWTTLFGYVDLLTAIRDLGIIDNVAPVQLAIRLLVPNGSRLLDLEGFAGLLASFDADALAYPWTNSDSRVDALYADVRDLVEKAEAEGQSRRAIFAALWRLAHEAAGLDAPAFGDGDHGGTTVPRMSEPWYCCAEPTSDQFSKI